MEMNVNEEFQSQNMRTKKPSLEIAEETFKKGSHPF